MYPGKHAAVRAEQPAFIMASTGDCVTYGEFEERANRLAHLLAELGLRRLDHFSLFMENNDRYLEVCAAGERSGLYFTCVNSYLTADELAYIVNNSESKVLITSVAKLDVARDAVAQCPAVIACLVVGSTRSDGVFVNYEEAVSSQPTTPLEAERLGSAMLYSSGTTGRPKGIVRPLPDVAPDNPLPLYGFLHDLWGYRDGITYLSPAPLYHSAPQTAVNLALRCGGTVIIMEKFDPEHYLELVERYRVTHSQLVPTMFSRMLKLPEATRLKYDVSSLEVAVHAAAPCPVPVKLAMIDWWGPIIHEYYGATEGMGFTSCTSEEWLDASGHRRPRDPRRVAHSRR